MTWPEAVVYAAMALAAGAALCVLFWSATRGSQVEVRTVRERPSSLTWTQTTTTKPSCLCDFAGTLDGKPVTFVCPVHKPKAEQKPAEKPAPSKDRSS